MKKMTALVLALALLFAFANISVSSAEEVVNLYNWYDYMDESIFDLFYQETGIKVNCMYFTTNEDMMVQVRVSPGAYDVVIPSDYCVERMINEGLITKINMDNIPNRKNITESLLAPDYDPNGEYTVPFMWGTLGILYDKTKVTEPVDSWSILWDEKYAGQIIMMNSIRDTLGLALKYLGYSLNTDNLVELKAAKDLLVSQKPLVKAYFVDETKDKMVAGEAALSVVYSGDAQYAIDLNSNLAYVVPKEGSNIWIDPLVIPATAKNKENAEKFIDFLCRPDIARMNCEYIRYCSPNAAAIELMGDEYTQNPVLNPPTEVIDNCEFFHDLPDNILTVYNTFWNQIKSSK